MNEKAKTDIPEITNAELTAALNCPAPYSNKMYVTMSEVGMRITFAERREGVELPSVRSAVFLSLQDAIAFRDLIVRQVDMIEVVLGEESKPKIG